MDTPLYWETMMQDISANSPGLQAVQDKEPVCVHDNPFSKCPLCSTSDWEK